MLDWDIVELYGVETRSLNQAVKRNKERFPPNFRFQLTKTELSELITDCDKFGQKRHYPGTPSAFTEQGIAMLSAVLRSSTAIKVSIKIMEAFVALRHAFLSSAGILQRLGNVEVKQIETDKRLDTVFDALDRSKLLPCGILPANSEYDSMLVDKVARFLVELGAGFSYVGKALPISVGGDEFELDLLFYHVVLHRYVVIELKTGKFHPKDLGQLGFYMTAIDRQVKAKVDGKTIGILLCKSRNDIVAEYALSDLRRPIGVSTYQLGLPSAEQLQAKLQKLLVDSRDKN